jgi:signal recognition particle subunit SRP54
MVFQALTEKLQAVLGKLIGQRQLTEENIREAAAQVRLALLEADVHFDVADRFVETVCQKAVGTETVKSVSPGQQFVKVVHDALVELMGGDEVGLQLKATDGPPVVMVCGLQGSGKTTLCAKLAKFVVKQKLAKRPLLVACDLQRPAAIEQLKRLAQQAGVDVFAREGTTDAVAVAREALAQAKSQGYDLVILDTAGRLHLDEGLMEELQKVRQLARPCELLFVANAATGQDAVNSAAAFDQRVAITGTVLTMLDGSTRGGAALSIREVTRKPLKFEGVGEKLEDLQLFNPRSMADRILGMGDVINLVRTAQEHWSEQEAEELTQKLRRSAFTYEDYLKMVKTMGRMGSMQKLMGMMPTGMPEMDPENAEGVLRKTTAMIHSMTSAERLNEVELSVSRRKRVARGSGVELGDVDRLIRSLKQAQMMAKMMPSKQALAGKIAAGGMAAKQMMKKQKGGWKGWL